MPKLSVNGKEVEFEQGMTVLQACELAGEEIPRFCYHERLKIAGNCRMCLVQIEGGPPKPAASCAMPAGDGMVVHTNSPMVKKAREGVMEFLLANHPLDCPICDQGGECDLQDQAMAYGRDRSRYDEPKRAVKDKEFGPLIKTEMTRCIHCTRCVRFLTEIAGCNDLGATGRGEDMEIGTFVQKNVSSELSGNIIDLCPVGALTSKPYAFSARSWELRHTESVDVMDAAGSNIRIDARGDTVMRIVPRLNEDINEEWISDKTRFSYDGLKLQRLDRPLLRADDGKLYPCEWDEALSLAAEKLSGAKAERVGAIIGDMCDAESMAALGGLFDGLGSANIDCRQDGAKLEASERSHYLFNTKIADIEKADICLMIGAFPRYDAPMVNLRMRARALTGECEFYAIDDAPEADHLFDVKHMGADAHVLEKILSGEDALYKKLQHAKNPMIIVGAGAYCRDDGAAIVGAAYQIAQKFGVITDEWNGFNILHRVASRVGGLDLGLVPGSGGRDVAGMLEASRGGDMEVLYLLAADEFDISQLRKEKAGNVFVIYQGHHGDAGARRADLILPGAAYTEKDGTYVNLEGRVQRGYGAVSPPGQAREDWRIISDIAARAGKGQSYEDIAQLREAMIEHAPHFAAVDEVTRSGLSDAPMRKGKIAAADISLSKQDFYMTNPIARASCTMASCSEAFSGDKKEAA